MKGAKFEGCANRAGVAGRPDAKDATAGCNAGATTIYTEHSSLERTGDSPFRSQCPFCPDGVLPTMRDAKTLELVDLDVCTFCGQQVRYFDTTIGGEPVRKLGGPRP